MRHNHYYENIDGKETCIDEEIPFEIGKNWCWTRLKTIAIKLTDGSHNPPANSGIGYPVISAKNVINGGVCFDNVDRFASESDFIKENKRSNLSNGDTLLCIIGGSIGKVGVYNSNRKAISQKSHICKT